MEVVEDDVFLGVVGLEDRQRGVMGESDILLAGHNILHVYIALVCFASALLYGFGYIVVDIDIHAMVKVYPAVGESERVSRCGGQWAYLSEEAEGGLPSLWVGCAMGEELG